MTEDGTSDGVELTDEVLERLAAEAERGYDADHLRPRFTCPACGAHSPHPDDIAQGYCGRCHGWTGVDQRPGHPSTETI